MGIVDKYKEILSKPNRSIDYWAEGAVLDFTEDLARIMHQNDVSRAELAKRVGTSPAYITKVFSGEANFTIETMTKFALAVDHVIRIHVAPEDSRTVWHDVYTSDYVQASDSPAAEVAFVSGLSLNNAGSVAFEWQVKAAKNG
ncbi:MAG: helix-turn-helix transcriptional regulator [Proteobacteria bacterium]|nr:helix-turn-helix transcriptional regulator [Pseudomonadota bacterium]